MKLKVVIIILSAILTVSGYAQLTSYTFNRKLDPVTKEDYYSVPLTPELAANCKSNLNDIRIYNIVENDTIEVPYLVEWKGDKTEEMPINFELINDVTHLKCCSYVTLKMEKRQVINRINLNVQESNFDKILVIQGSNDNKEWFTIKGHIRISGFVSTENNFRSTTVSFPSAEYAYFRISFDDDSSSKITVNAANAYEYKTIKGEYDELMIKTKDQKENKKEKTSEFITTFPFNYLINHIKLKSSSKEDFYRNINIYASTGTYHTPKGEIESWQQVSSGVIASNEENLFALGNVQTNKLKIEVINYDNEPIIISEIKAFSERLNIITKLPQSENLYIAYGKENNDAPVYDMVHFKDKIPDMMTEAKYGKENRKEAVLSAGNGPLVTNKKWLWIAMGIVILIIGYFSLNMIRKEKGEGS